jgi:hypothetical protein
MLVPEPCYMLPAYSALALLSAEMLEGVRHWIARRHPEVLANNLLGVAVGFTLAWAGWIARQTLSIDDVPMPF